MTTPRPGGLRRRLAGAVTDRRTLLQMIRYGCVGVINTLLTLTVIFVMKGLMGCDEWISNAVGYTAGFLNSFVWNKLWVFKSSKNFFRESVMFGLGFLVCYAIQAMATWGILNLTPLNDYEFTMLGMTFSGYSIATLAGMAIYTIANFVYNRCVTFR
ncbi:MAG: GtrA family protein [Clostridium sp.]|nr:GtrA family protein [Clostridium sp.]